MFDFLDRMRKEPLSKRRTIAFVISLLFTSAIGTMWYVAVFPELGSTKISSVDFVTPQEALSANITTALDGLKDSLSSLRQVITPPATDTPSVSVSAESDTVSTTTGTTTPEQGL